MWKLGSSGVVNGILIIGIDLGCEVVWYVFKEKIVIVVNVKCLKIIKFFNIWIFCR